MHYIRALVPRPQAPCLFVRLLGANRWYPTGFSTVGALRQFLMGSKFLMLDFGSTAWLIAPEGHVFEVCIARGKVVRKDRL